MLKSIHLIWFNENSYLHSDEPGYFRWRSFPKVHSTHVNILEWFIVHNEYVPELFHFQDDWLHISSFEKYKIMLVSTDFRPQTYSKLIKQFIELSRNDVSNLFQKIVSLFVEFSIKDKQYLSKEQFFKKRIIKSDEDILTGNGVKSIVKLFGLDVILVYTAILLRKRILVHDHCFESILRFLSALIGLNCSLREELINNFYPNIDFTSSLQRDSIFRGKTFYIVSCRNFNLQQQLGIFDIFVNIPAVEIVISPQSKSIFAMTKVHKEIATNIVRVAENSSDDESISLQIEKKTQELLKSLKNFIHNDSKNLNRSMLSKHQLSTDLEEFYWNLALVEGIAQAEQS